MFGNILLELIKLSVFIKNQLNITFIKGIDFLQKNCLCILVFIYFFTPKCNKNKINEIFEK
jgi:hypothetical protein